MGRETSNHMKITREGYAIIEGDTYLSVEIEKLGRLDVQRDMLMKYKQHIPEGGVVVDVGASLGDTAATFSEMVGNQGLVWALEPNYEVHKCLAYNVSNLPNVIAMSFGLGDSIEGVNLIRDGNNIGASRLERSDSHGEMRCHVRTMDSMTFDRIDFIKIDAEGWEPLILDGAVETINRFRPAMLIEVNTWPLGKMNFTPNDIWTRLDRLDYVYEKFDGPYGDVLCLPRERWIQPRH